MLEEAYTACINRKAPFAKGALTNYHSKLFILLQNKYYLAVYFFLCRPKFLERPMPTLCPKVKLNELLADPPEGFELV